MPEIICVNCQVKYKPIRNGVPLIKMFNDPPQPFSIKSSDLWQCPKCNHRIIAGIADIGSEYSEHFQENFQKDLAKAKLNNPVYCYKK